MTLLRSAEMDEAQIYRLLSGLVVPRPIAWVSTCDERGVPNLAPFSFFTPVSVSPPMLLFAVERRDGVKKDTLRNIEATHEYVVNIASDDMGRAVAVSALDYPFGESEFRAAGVMPAASQMVKPPRVAEAPASMECVLEQILEVGGSPHALIIGRVVAWHMVTGVTTERGRVDFDSLRPLGRLAGDEYIRCTERLRIERMDRRGAAY